MSHLLCVLLFFFFQAEDGIRDGHVTGVQTCALPICSSGRTSYPLCLAGLATLLSGYGKTPYNQFLGLLALPSKLWAQHSCGCGKTCYPPYSHGLLTLLCGSGSTPYPLSFRGSAINGSTCSWECCSTGKWSSNPCLWP